MVQTTLTFRRRLRRWIVWLWSHEGTPGQMARGLAIGVFCGCFPLFGLQTLLGIALASALRANHLLAAVGTWISNPVTYLPLYWLNYQVGEILLGIRETTEKADLNQLQWHDLWMKGCFLGSRLLLGSTVVGLIAGCFVGGFAYCLLRVYPRRR